MLVIGEMNRSASPLAGLSAAHRMLLTMLLLSASLPGATLTVGPGQAYQKPCQAIAVATEGDIIEIDASGNYDGDVCAWSTNNLTLRGIGGRASIDANGNHSQGKGIWVTYAAQTTVENVEFSGATVPDRNGAGIRLSGKSLTVRNCYFHDNENGILGGAGADAEILIENSVFSGNGYGNGYSHNIYIGHAGRFTMRYCYSRNANIGHLVKSRAAENYILYNRLSTEDDGNASYEIDIPNAGKTYLIGNIIHQGASVPNGTLVSYGNEGYHPDNPSDELVVVNNTFVSRRTMANFISAGSIVTTPVVVRNNIFTGVGVVVNQPSAVREANFVGDPGYVDADEYDYRLASESAAIDAGVAPGVHGGFTLTPERHYVHTASSEPRTITGTIDIGAYESNASAGGADKAGVFQSGSWSLDADGDCLITPGTDFQFILGWAGATPVVGDWNGDGTTKAGMFSDGLWYLDYDGNGVWDGGVVDRICALGMAGDQPVTGDWNGSGSDKIGIYRNGLWALDYNGDGLFQFPGADKAYFLGRAGDQPIVGDWDASGCDKIGIYRNGLWALDHNGDGLFQFPGTDKAFFHGIAGDMPIIGDWNGSGSDKIGIFRNGLWALDYDGDQAFTFPGPDKAFFHGLPGDKPVIGDWNGSNSHEVGIFRNGLWALDTDGSFTFVIGQDQAFVLGTGADTPVVGAWHQPE